MSWCFYHKKDLDGICGGAIIKRFIPDCVMVGLDYGDDFDFHISLKETVYMVDYSLSPFKEMLNLKSECRQLIWLDHHISSIKDRDESGVWFDGYQRTDRSGCELTWQYMWDKDKTDNQMPLAVHLLGRHDIWDHRNPVVKPFQYGMRAKNLNVDSELWNELLSPNESIVPEIIADGNTILKYVVGSDAHYTETYVFEDAFMGLRALFINTGFGTSDLFASIYDETKHDIMVTFCLTPKGYWSVSLRSFKDEVDCARIAKSLGGGGHQKASGFETTKRPWRDFKRGITKEKE